MATTIRLTRMGKKKRPFYRLVVLDSRKRRDGAYLANLGYYNPFVEPFEVDLHTEEIIDWLGKGATLSGTVRALLKSQGILYRYSLVAQGKSEAEIEAAMSTWREGAEARNARNEASRLQAARQRADAHAKAGAEKQEAAAEAESPAGDEAAAKSEAPTSEETDAGADTEES